MLAGSIHQGKEDGWRTRPHLGNSEDEEKKVL